MTPTRFAAPDKAMMVTVPLDGMLTVYHRPSGQTHLLAEPMPEILEVLAGGPRDVTGLLSVLGIEADSASTEALLARLSELEASGLVERL